MRRALGKMKRTISVLLAAAMIVTALPQTSVPVYASEAQDVLGEGSGAAETVGKDKEDNGTGNSGVDVDGNTDSGDTEVPDQVGPEESDAANQTDAGEEESPDGIESEETDVTDRTDTDDTEAPEEDADQTASDETLIGGEADAEQSKSGNTVSVLATEDDETAEDGETVIVRLNVPRYENDRYSFLKQVWYAVGDSSEFQRTNEQPNKSNKVDIPAKAGEKLRIKLVLRDRARIEEVSYIGLEEDAEIKTIEPETGEDHVYAIDNIPAGSGTEPVYQINIRADYYYSLSFVDVYASKNPDAENNKSVAFYQYAKDASGDGEADGNDLIGETLELTGQEMQKFFSEYNYALEVQKGYTFYSIDANSSVMYFKGDRSYYENGYTLSGSYDLGAEDITVFVLAEPTKQNHLKFNIPEELKDKVQVTVIEEDPEYGPAGLQSGLEDDDAVWIDSDRKVSFDVTIKDMNHTVRVTCEENGGDAVALPYNYRSEQSNGWKNHFVLADADTSMENGDVTVNLEQINIYPVEFHLNPDEIDCIRMYAPIEKTFRYSDYSELGSLTAWASEEEQFKFTVEPAKGGTLIVSTSEDGSGELYAGYDSGDDYEDWNIYTVAPESSRSVYLTVVKGYQHQLDYDESDFDVKVCDASGNPIELSADHKFVRSTDYWGETFRIMVKMNSEKWTAASVIYEDKWDERQEAERKPAYDDEDNGYLCYLAENVNCKTYGTHVITIEGYKTHTITFEGNEEAVKEGIWLRQYEKDDWGDWVDWEYKTDIELDGKLEVKDDEEVYFMLYNIVSTTHRLNLSLSGSGDQVEVYEGRDFDRDGTLYHFKAVGDATINVELTERQQHTVTIEKGENVTDFKVSGSKTRPEGETGKAGTYLVRDGVSIAISGITGNESMTGYRGKVVCTIGEKSYEVPMKYGTEIDEEWISGACFGVEVTSDMTLTVDLVPTTQPTITFADMDKIASIKVWEVGKKPTEDNLYNSETEEAVLSDDKEYRLDFQLKDGYAAKNVVLKDKSSGEERVLELAEDEYRIYELGVPQGDAQITIEAVLGYTVMFDIPAGADITFAEDITNYGNDITKDSIQVMSTDSFRFRMTDGEDLYKLSVDSDAFTLDKILQRKYYDYDNYDEYYQYVLKPVAGAQIPEIVKIKAEEYAKHTVTLDYPVEIKKIYLLDDTGEDYTISGKQAEVQGTGTVLGVKAISGYAAKVSVQGKTSGESKELTPFRLAEDDVSEYYLGELSEDVTITVTAERSQQKLIFYKVGFYSPGNGVRIRDAGTKALYSANENHEDWEEDFEYPYSILKGSSISFTVEPRDGYEVDGVYANGKAVTPVQNISSQQNVYTVVPMADTLITVNISKIAEKYPITFTYPAAVKSVTVKGYDLTDKKLEVKAGTKLEFTVELADTRHRITSVAMNGKEAAFNKNSGCYSITTVAEPMEIVITTVENIDKEVTFKNTVSHMLYSVVTNAQVTESGTDTYTVAALAGVLRFTVTSAKKESVPAISYVNAAGSKIVLQAKTKQESESTIAYTYEIAVSELAAESEIVIEETSTASAEDKAKLEECINKYKDKYNQEEYTPESWAVYTKALKAAEDCMKKDGATKAEVEAAIADLEKAVKGLTKKGEEPTPGAKEGLWFEILENDETADGSYIYTGAAIKPEINVYFDDKPLEVKKDYTVAYKNNTNAGPATITVTGKGNFKGNAAATFEIKKKDISDADISVADVYASINAKGDKVTNPKVTVKYGKKTLSNNNDYKVIWPEDSAIKGDDGKIKPGVYDITITTKEAKKKGASFIDSVNYSGEKTIKYTVLKNDIKLMSKAKVTLAKTKVDYKNNDQGYGKGTEQPAVTSVKIGTEILEEGVDYEVSYENWDQIGKATVTVTAKDGNTKYYGSKSVTYTVNGTKLATAGFVIEGINKDGYQYTGSPIYINQEAGGTLAVKSKSDGAALTEGTDYTVSYATGKKAGEHTGAGTVTVTITGINAYTGSMKTTFKITPVDLTKFGTPEAPAELKFAAEGAAKYTKTGAKPRITELSFNGTDLVEKQDYTVTYQKNNKVETVAGNKSAAMIIKGKGNFKGQIKHTYAVTIASADDVYATATDIVVPTKFNQVKSTVKVFEKGTDKALKAGTDYDKNITYYSDAECTKQITEQNFATDAGLDKEIYAKIDMKATGSYAGTTGTTEYVKAKFRVYDSTKKMTDKKVVVTVDTTQDKDGKPISHDTSKAKNPYYTGKDIEPKVTVTIKGTGDAADTVLGEEDYTVAYTNNKNKGKATITVTGIGNGYGGSKSVKFTIVPKNMEWAEQAVKQAAEFLSNLMFAPN